ncbi:hypothetical protein F4679DRAFT_541912 [Xylaria curta]|nr:hypothetical protein F4679DRAFT_541912 [Xylaria curta]
MSNSTIGWQAGPTERGTLVLVYGCLITIFTCTWTVLHLNVPGVNDKWWEIAMRKMKWMAITILLPEFIFAKAICDLRLALQNLHEFDTALKEIHKDNLEWTDSHQYIKHTYSWRVDYGLHAKRLYQILRLPLPDDQSRPVERIAEYEENDSDVESSLDAEAAQVYANRLSNFHTVQLWTLTHAYFANMGGLVYSPGSHQGELQNSVLTGSKLSLAYSWYTDHPLRGLILRKGDIEDKSKADWLLKCLAVSQVIWLGLTVIVRGINGLPVTQLEIATLAFSISAIATYAANWWKPKDVSQPIRISRITPGRAISGAVDKAQSFTMRFVFFEQASFEELDRVRNDETWIGGTVPLIFNIMAVFSLVFGGIHLIAWNFEFPSRAELMLWRASSLTSTILPLIIIMPNLYLGYLATTHTDNKLISSLDEMVKSQDKSPVEFLDMLKRLYSILIDENKRNIFYARANSGLQALIRDLLEFHALWENHQATGSINRLGECFFRIVQRASDTSLNEYENYIHENSIASDIWDPIKHYICSLIRIWKPYDEEEKRLRTRRDCYSILVALLTLSGSILYIISRLIILVLLFTSLRAVPKGVYDNTPWTRFLPSFS